MPQIKGKDNRKNSLKNNGLKIKKQRHNEVLFHTLRKGSLTVETSLVLPLFLFAMVTVLYLFRVLQIQYLAGNALDRAVAETALLREESPETVAARTKILFYKELVQSEAPLFVVVFGMGGFSWKGSEIDGRYLDMRVQYQIKIPGWMLGKRTLKVEETSRCRRWTGDNGDKTNGSIETWVYVTPSGKVYHKSRKCTHLKLSVKSIHSKRLSGDMKKYRECERCVKKRGLPAKVYVAKEGECYHIRLDCSGLKRTLYMIRLSQTGSKTACLRCKGE